MKIQQRRQAEVHPIEEEAHSDDSDSNTVVRRARNSDGTASCHELDNRRRTFKCSFLQLLCDKINCPRHLSLEQMVRERKWWGLSPWRNRHIHRDRRRERWTQTERHTHVFLRRDSRRPPVSRSLQTSTCFSFNLFCRFQSW